MATQKPAAKKPAPAPKKPAPAKSQGGGGGKGGADMVRQGPAK